MTISGLIYAVSFTNQSNNKEGGRRMSVKLYRIRIMAAYAAKLNKNRKMASDDPALPRSVF